MDYANILTQFGIKCKNIKSPAHTAIAQVYIIDGKFVLRARSLFKNTIGDFRRECELINKVRKLVPYKFPEPMSSISGKKFVIMDNLLWTVYPLIMGKVFGKWQNLKGVDHKQTIDTFKALHKLHQYTNGKLGKSSNYFINDINIKLNDVKDIISINENIRIRKAISIIKKTRYEPCFVHGDFHPGNIIVDTNGNIKGLIDLDWSRVGSPLEDLSYLVTMYLKDYKIPFRLNRNKLNKLAKLCKVNDNELFYEYLILYTLYDVHVFKHAKLKKYFEFQKSMLKEVCRIF